MPEGICEEPIALCCGERSRCQDVSPGGGPREPPLLRDFPFGREGRHVLRGGSAPSPSLRPENDCVAVQAISVHSGRII